ncbi:hypothetical protein FRC02_007048 [Tulasnella sp. 418]|nr:hypothetical protein FRC02_007048 [Tulasnella sp. 418]
MKPAVVERIPGQAKTSGPSTRVVDSDDEDEASEVATEKEEEGDEEFDPGEDMDLAALQREVALDYFSKREGLRNKAEEHGIPTSFASSQPQSSGNDAWDQEWVPLEASLAAQQPKSSQSRFKAARSTKPQLSSTMSMPVQAVGSEHFSTQIKEGKVVDGKLVAPADSDEDDAEISEEGKRLIAKLRAREEEVPSPLPTSSQSTAAALESAKKESAKPAAESKGRRSALVGEIKERSAPGPSPPKPSTTTSTNKPQRPSRFMTAQHDTGSATPPSVVGRSSPKLSGTNTPKHQPPSVVSAKSSKPANANKPSSSALTSGTANAPAFPLPEGFEDFMREAHVDPTSLSSNVIVSPSFLPPSAATATKIFNPENVMRREVKENAPGKFSDSTETPKRVSRFKAQRI